MTAFGVLMTSMLFVGSHLALSHPLRRPMIAALGEKGFSAVYAIVAFGSLGATVWAYRATPVTPMLWPVGDGLWALSTILMLAASILFMGSFVRNPALPGAESLAASAKAKGVFAVTRHPMMWSFAIWGIAHIFVYPVAKNVILSGAIILLALLGAWLQDGKKAMLDPQGWPQWKARTGFFPFAAVAAGKADLRSFGMHALGGGVVLWLVATWAHIPLAGWAAGIWRWLT